MTVIGVFTTPSQLFHAVIGLTAPPTLLYEKVKIIAIFLIRYQVSGIRYQVSGIRYQVPGFGGCDSEKEKRYSEVVTYRQC
jgi:hypothetical protein